ncbi:hypothetical protein DdX_08565 [Ditylenchus destructor]|uniref:G protein-coupled receptor n=1 Tax=Ditylenchus destructor TaxID=166010 RepID=A0AAD4R6Z7_9BILA|nr:hypothetical protein DdX_08565 [Ditylenchus destructor]
MLNSVNGAMPSNNPSVHSASTSHLTSMGHLNSQPSSHHQLRVHHQIISAQHNHTANPHHSASSLDPPVLIESSRFGPTFPPSIHASDFYGLGSIPYAIPNCTYRYDLTPEDDQFIGTVSLYLDGPLTLLAAVLALVGGHFAVRFLGRAGLNKDLTAALYMLCICDAFLIIMVVLYHSIEASSILLTGSNAMWNEQDSVLYTHGVVSAATTASTLLVVFITFQRFLVVLWPMKYAKPTRAGIPVRKTSSVEDVELSNGLLTRTLSKRLFHRKTPSLKKAIRPFMFPACVVAFAIAINSTVFFEFELVECFAFAHRQLSTHLFPTALRQSQTYNAVRTVIMMTTQTVGPISTISLLTVITEYKVHASLKARRILFEAQHRRRSVVMVEELKEKLSRTVAIFIAVKFLILRSLPIFFDIYETFYGIESFGIILSILVRLSDFGVVLNAATNSLAYFGRTSWFEMRLRGRLMKKRQGGNPSTACTNGSSMHSTPQSFKLGSSKQQSTTANGNTARSTRSPASPRPVRPIIRVPSIHCQPSIIYSSAPPSAADESLIADSVVQ